jgi:adenine-specific DNA glycosylase
MLCRRGDALLMVRQPAKGLLADLWDLPSMAREEREPAPEALLRCARERLGVDARPIARLGAVRHAFTHLDWHTEIYAVELLGEPLASYYPERRFVDAVELSALPLSSLARRSVATAISQPEPEIDGER